MVTDSWSVRACVRVCVRHFAQGVKPAWRVVEGRRKRVHAFLTSPAALETTLPKANCSPRPEGPPPLQVLCMYARVLCVDSCGEKERKAKKPFTKTSATLSLYCSCKCENKRSSQDNQNIYIQVVLTIRSLVYGLFCSVGR